MISIIVPTLNESKNILKFVKNLKFLKFKYELIFVDDNSSDNSNHIFQKITNKTINFIIRKAVLSGATAGIKVSYITDPAKIDFSEMMFSSFFIKANFVQSLRLFFFVVIKTL